METTAPKLHRSVEEQAMDAYIQQSGELLQTIRTRPALLEKFNDYGFDDAELATGMAMQEAAQPARGAGSDGADGGAADLRAKALEARDCFTAFRTVARAAFPGLSDRINLKVTGDVPDDLQRFVTAAHGAYSAACDPPYAEKLARRNFAVPKLLELKADLDAIAKAGAAEAEDETTNADREARREAYNELKEFMKELKGIGRAIFRKDPEMLSELKLNE